LRTHIAALRKALGDGEDGARYIATVPGRVMRMVGRVDDVRLLATQLAAERLVTMVGAGGVGKTTVAVAVAHEVSDSFGGAVLFVDLGMLSDPKLAATRYHDTYRRDVHVWRFRERLLTFLYYVPTSEYLDALGAGLATRNRAYDLPQPADWPEPLSTWQAYYGS
jgi:hypothetical protein